MPERPAHIRVVLFIDGQNLYHSCYDHFGHGYVHPHLLAQEILKGRELSGVRYYTGIHDPHIRPKANAIMQRRLDAMKKNGVYTWTHPLKYSEREMVDHDTPCCDHGFCKVDVVKHGREKGIDLRIGLDMLRMARHREYDVASLASQDTDLNQAVHELMLLRSELYMWLACENVYPYSASSAEPNFRLMSCPRWHIIDEAMFSRIRDDTDYR